MIDNNKMNKPRTIQCVFLFFKNSVTFFLFENSDDTFRFFILDTDVFFIAWFFTFVFFLRLPYIFFLALFSTGYFFSNLPCSFLPDNFAFLPFPLYRIVLILKQTYERKKYRYKQMQTNANKCKQIHENANKCKPS